ncbi:MAG TPA: SDR family oxidoreductase [Tepidisphaeraceae bacterium]|nr:SDR family oxidoreductase [Tepidisphaeraceae bacterium]
MAIKLKKLKEQVIVITGASSGIGLCTAQGAARCGAKVVLAARSGETLDVAVGIIAEHGGECISVVCDVSDAEQVQHLAREAINRFGRIDTWINNAGVAIYGRLDEVSDADSRRLFDINFWGVVNGCRAALPHLKQQGGALINIGSEVSEAYVPILGMYSASKHAVKGFTDALRVEIERLDNAPVSVTLIQPTAVDTPFDEHSRNYMEREAKLPSNMIDPQQVADAILKAAVKPKRWVKVGAMAKLNTITAKAFPGVTDRMTAKQAEDLHRDEPPRDPAGALYHPTEDGRVHGDHPNT